MAPQVQIFFGSQTGTAECFSEEICDEAKEQGIECEVIDLLTFKPDTFAARKIVLLVVSTYGEGEPSDNAVQFHRWVSDPRNDGGLKGQRFAVMGLGDMNYSKFNNMGMMTDQNLERMGATRIYRRGVGDDSQDIHADFKEWKDGGLWAALKKAIAEVMEETGGAGFATAGAGGGAAGQQIAAAPKVAKKPELHVFFGHEEADGAAKDICESVVASLKEQGMVVPIVQNLSDRKSVEVVRKLPRKAVAVVIADCNQDGLCGSGRKLVRNMNLELDSSCMSDKCLSLAFLAVASSKCNNSASALRDQMEKSALVIPKAFDRAGIKPLGEELPQYLDAGVDKVEPVLKELTAGLVRHVSAATEASETGPAGPGAAPAAAAAVVNAKKTRILCAGGEAREAGEALAAAWPGGNTSVEDAALGVLASAAQERAQVVLAVECAADGGLSDEGRGLAAQLGAAPMAIKASLRQVRFAMLAIAGTHYGNAGERASANAARDELTRAAAPVMQALQKLGAGCVADASMDLQDADGGKLAELGSTLLKGFSEGAAAPAAQAANGYPVTTAPVAPTATSVSTKLELKMAGSAGALPAEVPGEPADVLARFYFEADQAKVVKVRELRQAPDAAQGLATAEVEFEAAGGLKEYTLGGTFSLLPENDPADVSAALGLMGLSETNLGQYITFAPADGGAKIKRPFPTPCTLKEALSRYCDLGRAPTKKMLTALQPKLENQEARERVGKLLADVEAMKVLQGAALCCKMHEFWAMLGVKKISPVDFLLSCPRQKAREFTIASSPKATPTRITLCVSMTSHELPNMEAACKQLVDAGCLPPSASSLLAGRGRFFGTCSRWLTGRLKAGDTVLAKQRPSPLHLPGKDVPIIMVGAGAGVAPFRGFWEELRRGSQTAPAALFFGCRNADQDWLFKEEMSSAVKLTAGCGALARMQVGPKRPLACLFTAFSRPGEGKTSKYVQDDVRAQSTSVKHWIEKMSGSVFICGSTAMGNGVLEALAETLEGGRDTVDALRKEGRIVAEMWG